MRIQKSQNSRSSSKKRRVTPRRHIKRAKKPAYAAMEELTAAAWNLLRKIKINGSLAVVKSKYSENTILKWMVSKGIITKESSKKVKKNITVYLLAHNGESILREEIQEVERLKVEVLASQTGSAYGSKPPPPKLSEIKERQLDEKIKKNKLHYHGSLKTCVRNFSSKKHHAWFEDEQNISTALSTLEGYTDHYESSGEISAEDATVARTIIKALRAIQSASRIEDVIDAFKPFKWPTTEIQRIWSQRMDGIDLSQGLLGVFEYHVGKTGDHELERRQILRKILSADLAITSQVKPRTGPPNSCARLKVVAHEIAAHVRRARLRRQADMSYAISDWVEDLAWLKKNFYVGKCDLWMGNGKFNWPQL